MKKVLVIPHHPVGTATKIRLGQIAEFLTEKTQVYMLNWSVLEGKYSLGNRVKAAFKDLFTLVKVWPQNNLNVVRLPLLRRPLGLAIKFNSYWLNKFIADQKIDVLVNGSYYMFALQNKSVKYILDLADLPVSEQNSRFDQFIQKIVSQEAVKADKVTAVSRQLCDYVLKTYNQTAVWLPNGADIAKFRSQDQAVVGKLRLRYNLAGKFVIGYVGYIGDWVNLDLVLAAFKLVKTKISNAHLLFVGSSPDFSRLKQRYADTDVTFTGGVTEEIEPYFSLLDLGLLPHKKSLFQDLAFHLKIIEYSAAAKFVLSVPLKETMLLGLPNIYFAQETAELWAEKIVELQAKTWQPGWNELVDKFSWDKIVAQLITLF